MAGVANSYGERGGWRKNLWLRVLKDKQDSPDQQGTEKGVSGSGSRVCGRVEQEA